MKGKKLVIAVILALIVCLVLIPTCVFADGEGDGTGNSDSTPTYTDTETVNPNVDTSKPEEDTYKTLQEAVNDAGDSTKITVTDNLTEEVTIETENTIVIDLGGNTLNGANANTPAVTVNSGTVTLDNGTINGRIKVENDAKVTLGKDLILNGGLEVWGTGTGDEKKMPEVNVNCTINGNDTYSSAAVTDRSVKTSGATINIGDGATVVGEAYRNGISLFGGSSALNVKGDCIIKGSIGIDMASGSLKVTNMNAKIEGTGGTGYDAKWTGAAIKITYDTSYFAPIGTVEISGGIFRSGGEHKPIEQSVVTEAKYNFITGGRFYGQAPGDDLIATNAAQAWAGIDNDKIYAVGKDSIEALAKSAKADNEVHVTAIYGENNEYVNGRYWVRSVEGVAAGVVIQNDTGDTTKTEIAINGLVKAPGEYYVVPGATPDPDPDPDPKPTPAPVVVPEQTTTTKKDDTLVEAKKDNATEQSNVSVEGTTAKITVTDDKGEFVAPQEVTIKSVTALESTGATEASIQLDKKLIVDLDVATMKVATAKSESTTDAVTVTNEDSVITVKSGETALVSVDVKAVVSETEQTVTVKFSENTVKVVCGDTAYSIDLSELGGVGTLTLKLENGVLKVYDKDGNLLKEIEKA